MRPYEKDIFGTKIVFKVKLKILSFIDGYHEKLSLCILISSNNHIVNYIVSF